MPELAAYYADRKLMGRNIALIGLCHVGWGVVAGIVGPLVAMQLLELGVRENIQATINSANGLTLGIGVSTIGLVMFFNYRRLTREGLSITNTVGAAIGGPVRNAVTMREGELS